MFTGIIENTGIIQQISSDGSNKTFWISSPLSGEFKIDQSVSHDGVCLTIEEVKNGSHRITAIGETLLKTNLGSWKEGNEVNIERCMLINGRIDGHIIQGHVDGTAISTDKKDLQGSWEYRFQFPTEFSHLVIEKGSIALNGISLTVFNITDDEFSVAIIPYTYQHTNMRRVKIGSAVNIEFDLVGKYLARFRELMKDH